VSRSGEATAGSLAPAGRAFALSPAWALRLAVGLLAGAGLFALLAFRHYGISNDEEVQHVYGRLLLDFYTSGFEDHSAFAYKNLYLYGGLFDLIAAGLERLFPAMNIWDLRHLLSAGFGIGGALGAWLLARRLAGEWAGLGALVVLLATGAWTGAMFTHTKDVPFAATMVWSLYFTVRVLESLPRPALRDVLGLGFALGCAFGLRVGAVFAVFYLGVSLMTWAWMGAADLRSRGGLLLRAVRGLWPAVLLAFALMALCWPWSVMAPENLYTAMTTFSHFSFQLTTILDGEVMKNGDVPGTYLAHYLLVRLPELFLIGIGLAALAGVRALPLLLSSAEARRAALRWLPVVLAAGFPLAYTLLAAPPLYNGIRHFTFLLPPLAVLGGAGLAAAWRWAQPWPRGRLLALGACAVLALGHAINLARLHPYEYVAYNSLAGGLHGTQERWEQDYWAATVKELVADLRTRVSREGGQTRPYLVAVCAEPLQAAAWLDARFQVTTDWRAADFFISPTHMDCHTAMQGRIVGEVVRDGVELGVLRDRRGLADDERIPR